MTSFFRSLIGLFFVSLPVHWCATTNLKRIFLIISCLRESRSLDIFERFFTNFYLQIAPVRIFETLTFQIKKWNFDRFGLSYTL